MSAILSPILACLLSDDNHPVCHMVRWLLSSPSPDPLFDFLSEVWPMRPLYWQFLEVVGGAPFLQCYNHRQVVLATLNTLPSMLRQTTLTQLNGHTQKRYKGRRGVC